MKPTDYVSPKSTSEGTRETNPVTGRYSDGTPLPDRETTVHDFDPRKDREHDTPSRATR